MYNSEIVLKGLECHMDLVKSERWASGCINCPFGKMDHCIEHLLNETIELLKEQEPRELTKEEWEQWKKDECRDPICMIWYEDTTPFWVLRPEEINEPLYLMKKIKLFTKKPPKEQVKWDEII